MTKRLKEFLTCEPLECASGGTPLPGKGKSRRHPGLALLLATLGFLSFLLPSPGNTTPRPSAYQHILDIFQIRMRRLKTPRTVVIVDHNLALDDIGYIRQRTGEELALRGAKTRTPTIPASFQKALKTIPQGFSQANGDNTLVLTTDIHVPLTQEEKDDLILHPNSPKARLWAAQRACSAMYINTNGTLAAPTISLPAGLALDSCPPFSEMLKGTLYHENFGHATERAKELSLRDIASGTPEYVYRRHLQELRAEIARISGMTQETGNTRYAWFYTTCLQYGCIRQFMNRNNAQLPYILLGNRLEKAARTLDRILGTPDQRDRFLHMTDEQLVDFNNTLLDSIKPTRESFCKNMETGKLLRQYGRKNAMTKADPFQKKQLEEIFTMEKRARNILFPAKAAPAPSPQPYSHPALR